MALQIDRAVEWMLARPAARYAIDPPAREPCAPVREPERRDAFTMTFEAFQRFGFPCSLKQAGRVPQERLQAVLLDHWDGNPALRVVPVAVVPQEIASIKMNQYLTGMNAGDDLNIHTRLLFTGHENA